jgi:hypothetical protein
VSKDILADLTTKGEGLSCEKVYLSLDDQEINRNTFVYGEKFFLNFNNLEGFNKENDYAFPGMQLVVIDHAGDTVLQNKDVYATYTNGIKRSTLILKANITVGKPMYSNSDYTLFVKIWDKKGVGKFTAQMDFDVVANDIIKIETHNISYNEIYLFSDNRKKAILDDTIQYNDHVNLIFEGLSGFREESGKVFLGLSLKATDSRGEVILDEKDLIGEMSLDISQLKSQIAPNFIFSGSNIGNPVTCEIQIWDKKSDNWIKTSMMLHVE